LDRRQFEPLVVFPDEGPMVDAARALGCEVLVQPCCHWLYFRRNAWYWKNLAGRMAPNVMALKRLIRERGIDLVYTNTSAIFEAALAARLARVPHVWHIHEVLQTGSAMDQLLPLRVMKRLIAKFSSVVVFESEGSRRVFEQSTPLTHGRVVYNSLRLANTDAIALRQTHRDALGIGPDDWVVAFMGQFIDRKNPLLLIRAAEHLRHLLRIRWLFVGEGPLQETMEQQIQALGLSDCCRVIEFQADVQPVMNAMDVFALPSRQESFGLVLIEAGAYGKPVVACRSQGPNEIVVDQDTGFLVPQDDAQSFAARIKELYESRSGALAMGEAGKRRVQELFDPAINTRRLETIFNEVLHQRREASLAAQVML
jgi:glycosyltransferase involved in cell wall biosynthesis